VMGVSVVVRGRSMCSFSGIVGRPEKSYGVSEQTITIMKPAGPASQVRPAEIVTAGHGTQFYTKKGRTVTSR
jgi:hypothetical protein